MQSSTQRHLNNERGSVLIIALTILFAMSLIAAISIEMSSTEMDIAGNMTRKTQALLAAEAGQARAEAIMIQNAHVTSSDSLTYLINADATLPNASFSVTMDTTMPLRRVLAVGTSVPGGVAAIQITYRHMLDPHNIWNNAIFAGHGQNARSIRGHVGIHGSVHILGDGESYTDVNSNGVWDVGEPYTDANHDGTYEGPLTADSMGLDMMGNASLSNNYLGMPASLSSRLPALPTTQYAGETVETLDATLRVKNGSVVIDGSALVGLPDVSGGAPAVKETFDAVYVSDGFSGLAGEDAVYSDNGTADPYDLEDGVVTMPNLDDPYTDDFGTSYPSYMVYLKSNALVIPGDLTLHYGTSVSLISSGNGSIALDAAGNLTATGIVYVEGNIVIDGASPILYDGRFAIVSEGDVTVDTDLLSKGMFPTDDVAGVISYGRTTLGVTVPQLQLTGAFFAQEEVIVGKQTQLAGTLISNYFNALQVPDIYQVPELVRNLPPGMPGLDDAYVYTWQRVPKSWVELD